VKVGGGGLVAALDAAVELEREELELAEVAALSWDVGTWRSKSLGR
jgi:hypothetical protein